MGGRFCREKTALGFWVFGFWAVINFRFSYFALTRISLFCVESQPQLTEQEFSGEKVRAFARKCLTAKNIARAIAVKTIKNCQFIS
jgi:hypothetical protein